MFLNLRERIKAQKTIQRELHAVERGLRGEGGRWDLMKIAVEVQVKSEGGATLSV